MDDPEMQWLQSKDPASCAVWEWLKADCQKRGTNQVRKLSQEEIEVVTRNLGIDSPKFSQISQNLHKVGWIINGSLKGWSKWQSSRTAEEDATRKQLEYWKSEAEQLRKEQKKSPKTSHDLPKPPLEERRGEEIRGEYTHTEECGIESFRKKLNKSYNRSDIDRWSCQEEQALVIVFGRTSHDSEFEELMASRESRGKFFPQSILRLLDNWTSTLDAARNGHRNGSSNSNLSVEYGTAAQSEARRKSEMEEIARLSKGSK